MSDKERLVYMDHAATTPLDFRVREAMEPWLSDVDGEGYGNASSMHTIGYSARRAIDDARSVVAGVLGCASQEVIFTAGGTESVNIALFGVARLHSGGHIVSTEIEHPAVLDSCRALEKEGYALSLVQPNNVGIVEVGTFTEAIQEDTMLVSVMSANNEIGTIQNVKELVAAAREIAPNVIFHTDACQASGALSLDVKELDIDLMTINASKIYGPKGVGALYVRQGVELKPLLYGGGQERGLRPGTENVAGIVGFAKALEISEGEREVESARLTELRSYFIESVRQAVPNVRLNGFEEDRLPNNVNLLFPSVDGQTLLIHLDSAGVHASLGSACAAGTVTPSHVLQAIGRTPKEVLNSIRFTMGRSTTKEDVDRTVEVLVEAVKKLS